MANKNHQQRDIRRSFVASKMASEVIAVYDLDPETAALILSLQLEDSKELFEAS
jgi:hypothetical protein